MVQTRFAAEAGDFRPIVVADLPSGIPPSLLTPGFLSGTGLVNTVVSSATVSGAAPGSYYNLQPGVTTVNLAAASANPGGMIGFINATGGNVTINALGGDAFFLNGTLFGVSSFVLYSRQSVVMYANGVTAWFLVGMAPIVPSGIAVNGPASGTWVPPVGTLWLDVQLVGGGAGGAGSGTGAGNGGAGGDTIFGSMTANGAGVAGSIAPGGPGGGASGGTWINSIGGQGGGSELSTVASGDSPGGHGGASFYGGGAGSTASGNPGANGQAIGSGGGGGAEATSTAWSAAGGGAGGYCRSIISPLASFNYTVGGGGAGGAAGTGGFAGGAGQPGALRVIAHFQ